MRREPPEPFDGNALVAAGWVYRYFEDPTLMLSLECWDAFLAIIGWSNYRILGLTKKTDPDGTQWRRGALMVSPRGMERLIAAGVKKKPPQP